MLLLVVATSAVARATALTPGRLGHLAALDAPNGGWSGTITFSHKIDVTNTDGTVKHEVSGATFTVPEQGTTNYQMSYHYTETGTSTCQGNSYPYSVTIDGSGSGSVDPSIGLVERSGDQTYQVGTVAANGTGTLTRVSYTGPNCSQVTDSSSADVGAGGVQSSDQHYDLNQLNLQGSYSVDLASQIGSETATGANTLTWNVSRSKRLDVTSLKLMDHDPHPAKGGPAFTPLRFLSTSDHPYLPDSRNPTIGPFGRTGIWGTMRIEGFPLDVVQSVKLEVLEHGQVMATEDLTDVVNLDLTGSLTAAGDLELVMPKLLFTLPSSDAAKFDHGTAKNDKLDLRVQVESDWDTTTKDYGEVEKLVRYMKANRYGPRDYEYGGDDWVLPSVREKIDYFTDRYSKQIPGLVWGDFSNMNGGHFYPHKSHQMGNDVDGAFDNFFSCRNGKPYSSRQCRHGKPIPTAYTARQLLRLLNDPKYGPDIKYCFVAYFNHAVLYSGHPNFYDIIHKARLRDGRRADEVIKPDEEHDTHFHLRFFDS